MDLEKDQAQPDEELQPIALGDVLLHGLWASIDDLADPHFDLASHQRVAVLAAGDFEASVAAASLSAILADGVVIEMHLPIDAFMDHKMPEVRAIQTALLASPPPRRRCRRDAMPIIGARS